MDGSIMDGSSMDGSGILASISVDLSLSELESEVVLELVLEESDEEEDEDKDDLDDVEDIPLNSESELLASHEATLSKSEMASYQSGSSLASISETSERSIA
jgi:hypothetical protein